MKRLLSLLVLILISIDTHAQPPGCPTCPQPQFVVLQPPKTDPPKVDPKTPVPKKFKTGLKPTPRHILLSKPQHKIKGATPSQFAVVPPQLSMWDNDVDGDCVTAEEAASKAAYSVMNGQPELFVPVAEVIRWATNYGFLNGANLTDVMDKMAVDGFNVNGVNYKDGPYASVDYSNESVLQNAISIGPVKLGIDSTALPSTAGNQQGWYVTGGTPGQFSSEDHCVALFGFGTAQYLFQQLGVALPAALQPTQTGYLLFTWSSIGFVDHAWIMSTVGEAWVRNPTTPGTPAPTPTPTPTPTPSPTPGPNPVSQVIVTFADGTTQTLTAVPANLDVWTGPGGVKILLPSGGTLTPTVKPQKVEPSKTEAIPPPHKIGQIYEMPDGGLAVKGTDNLTRWYDGATVKKFGSDAVRRRLEEEVAIEVVRKR